MTADNWVTITWWAIAIVASVNLSYLGSAIFSLSRSLMDATRAFREKERL